MKEYKGMKIGDLVTGYWSGYYELTEIKPNDQLRLVLKETSTRHTKDRVYSKEVVSLIDHENIKDDDIYSKLGHIYKVVGNVITQKVLRDEF